MSGDDVPNIAGEHESGGYFDKDAQGWCCLRLRITQEGRRVKVREWFDENGVVRTDESFEGTLGAVENGRVAIHLENGTVRYFNLVARELVR
jgi:hypothetical protein